MSRSRPPGLGALALGALFAAGAAAAQAPPMTPPAALPDLTGVWQNMGPPTNTDLFDGGTSEPRGCLALRQPCRSHPPYNAAWEAKYQAQLKRSLDGTLPDPLTLCMPRGVPGNMRSPDTLEFVVRPERVWIFIENGSQSRRIYTDGRGHRTGKDAFISYTGDSIGRWEGDTLVVETINFRSDLMIDRSGATLSDKARITERIRRIDENTIEDQFEIVDPVALTAPWKVQRLYRRVPGARIFDYACAENQRNPISEDGRTHTLDPSGRLLD